MSGGLHRERLLEGRVLTPRLEAELGFLDREGLLLPDDEFRRRLAAGEPIYPERGAGIYTGPGDVRVKLERRRPPAATGAPKRKSGPGAVPGSGGELRLIGDCCGGGTWLLFSIGMGTFGDCELELGRSYDRPRRKLHGPPLPLGSLIGAGYWEEPCFDASTRAAIYAEVRGIIAAESRAELPDDEASLA